MALTILSHTCAQVQRVHLATFVMECFISFYWPDAGTGHTWQWGFTGVWGHQVALEPAKEIRPAEGWRDFASIDGTLVFTRLEAGTVKLTRQDVMGMTADRFRHIWKVRWVRSRFERSFTAFGLQSCCSCTVLVAYASTWALRSLAFIASG